MTSRSQLQEIETIHTAEFNSGQIPEGKSEFGVLVKNDEGSAALRVATVAGLASTSAERFRIFDFDDIRIGMKIFEDGDSLGSLLEINNGGVVHHEWNFRDFINAMASR